MRARMPNPFAKGYQAGQGIRRQNGHQQVDYCAGHHDDDGVAEAKHDVLVLKNFLVVFQGQVHRPEKHLAGGNGHGVAERGAEHIDQRVEDDDCDNGKEHDIYHLDGGVEF